MTTSKNETYLVLRNFDACSETFKKEIKMAKGLNQVNLIGNLGDEPVVKQIQSKSGLVANFTLAINETHIDANGNKVENTEWVRVVAWGKLAEIVQKFLHKGSQVHITGKIRTRSYQDKEGQTRYTTEVHADELLMLSSPVQKTAQQTVNNTNAVANNNVNSNANGNVYTNNNVYGQPQPQNFNNGQYVQNNAYSNNGYAPLQPQPMAQPQYPSDDVLPF